MTILKSPSVGGTPPPALPYTPPPPPIRLPPGVAFPSFAPSAVEASLSSRIFVPLPPSAPNVLAHRGTSIDGEEMPLPRDFEQYTKRIFRLRQILNYETRIDLETSRLEPEVEAPEYISRPFCLGAFLDAFERNLLTAFMLENIYAMLLGPWVAGTGANYIIFGEQEYDDVDIFFYLNPYFILSGRYTIDEMLNTMSSTVTKTMLEFAKDITLNDLEKYYLHNFKKVPDRWNLVSFGRKKIELRFIYNSRDYIFSRTSFQYHLKLDRVFCLWGDYEAAKNHYFRGLLVTREHGLISNGLERFYKDIGKGLSFSSIDFRFFCNIFFMQKDIPYFQICFKQFIENPENQQNRFCASVHLFCELGHCSSEIVHQESTQKALFFVLHEAFSDERLGFLLSKEFSKLSVGRQSYFFRRLCNIGELEIAEKLLKSLSFPRQRKIAGFLLLSYKHIEKGNLEKVVDLLEEYSRIEDVVKNIFECAYFENKVKRDFAILLFNKGLCIKECEEKWFKILLEAEKEEDIRLLTENPSFILETAKKLLHLENPDFFWKVEILLQKDIPAELGARFLEVKGCFLFTKLKCAETCPEIISVIKEIPKQQEGLFSEALKKLVEYRLTRETLPSVYELACCVVHNNKIAPVIVQELLKSLCRGYLELYRESQELRVVSHMSNILFKIGLKRIPEKDIVEFGKLLLKESSLRQLESRLAPFVCNVAKKQQSLVTSIRKKIFYSAIQEFLAEENFVYVETLFQYAISKKLFNKNASDVKRLKKQFLISKIRAAQDFAGWVEFANYPSVYVEVCDKLITLCDRAFSVEELDSMYDFCNRAKGSILRDKYATICKTIMLGYASHKQRSERIYELYEQQTFDDDVIVSLLSAFSESDDIQNIVKLAKLSLQRDEFSDSKQSFIRVLGVILSKFSDSSELNEILLMAINHPHLNFIENTPPEILSDLYFRILSDPKENLYKIFDLAWQRIVFEGKDRSERWKEVFSKNISFMVRNPESLKVARKQYEQTLEQIPEYFSVDEQTFIVAEIFWGYVIVLRSARDAYSFVEHAKRTWEVDGTNLEVWGFISEQYLKVISKNKKFLLAVLPALDESRCPVPVFKILEQTGKLGDLAASIRLLITDIGFYRQLLTLLQILYQRLQTREDSMDEISVRYHTRLCDLSWGVIITRCCYDRNVFSELSYLEKITYSGESEMAKFVDFLLDTPLHEVHFGEPYNMQKMFFILLEELSYSYKNIPTMIKLIKQKIGGSRECCEVRDNVSAHAEDLRVSRESIENGFIRTLINIERARNEFKGTDIEPLVEEFLEIFSYSPPEGDVTFCIARNFETMVRFANNSRASFERICDDWIRGRGTLYDPVLFDCGLEFLSKMTSESQRKTVASVAMPPVSWVAGLKDFSHAIAKSCYFEHISILFSEEYRHIDVLFKSSVRDLFNNFTVVVEGYMRHKVRYNGIKIAEFNKELIELEGRSRIKFLSLVFSTAQVRADLKEQVYCFFDQQGKLKNSSNPVEFIKFISKIILT